jgi:GntR family transcriptional regulator
MFVNRPLYLQVRDSIAERIVAGVWLAGQALPNEIQLSIELGVSVGTIRKAMERLEAERIVVRRQGRGTFVSDQTTGEMAIRFSNILSADGLRIEGTVVPKSVARTLPTPFEAAQFQCAETATIVRIERVHTYHGHPYLVETCILPADNFASLPEDLGKYRIYVLAKMNNIHLGKAYEKVSAVMPSESDAADLQIDRQQPVLRLERIVHTTEGAIIEMRIARCFLREKHYSAVIP